jgi:hypothetical protein
MLMNNEALGPLNMPLVEYRRSIEQRQCNRRRGHRRLITIKFQGT